MKNIPVYSVDTGVPVPTDRSKQLPLNVLEVGESFLFPLDERNRVQTFASRLKSRRGKEFTIRKQDENTARVWRIK